MFNITEKFINELNKIKEINVGEILDKNIRRCFLDYIGVTYSGAKTLIDNTNKYIKFYKFKNPKIKLIGLNEYVDLVDSIFLNSIHSHYLELDDGERRGMLHPGGAIFSTIISYAKQHKVSYDIFCKAIVIGYEAAIRLARSIQPGHFKKGFHATSSCGSVGATMALATIFNFNEKQQKNALSSTLINSFGLLKAIDDTSTLKGINVAKASLNSYFSCLTAISGYDGPNDVLEGDRGFLNISSYKYDINELYKDQDYAINSVYFKSFASCRHCHPSVEAILNIKSKYPMFNINDIESVIIETYNLVFSGHNHTEIKGVSSAKMSIPYSVAAALILNDGGHEIFTEQNIQKVIKSNLINKIKIIEDKKMSQLIPKRRSAKVSIVLANKTIISEYIIHPKGEPENPLSNEEIIEKFEKLMIFSNQSEKLISKIINNVMFKKEGFMDLIIEL